MAISRRHFCAGLMAGGGLAATPSRAHGFSWPRLQGPVTPTGSHLGNLYPFVQGQANHSKFELSFLRPSSQTFGAGSLERAPGFSNISSTPRPASIRNPSDPPHGQGGLCRGVLDLPDDARHPRAAYVLVPKRAQLPAPGIVVLHSHDGIYLWARRRSSRTNRSIHT